MRVVGRETQYSYEPAVVWARPHYRHFWGGYWRWGWDTVYEPTYLQVDRVVKVETLVYSLVQDQLVWAGVSRTVDPAHIEDFIGELAQAVTDRQGGHLAGDEGAQLETGHPGVGRRIDGSESA
jgi:hypothetical protein